MPVSYRTVVCAAVIAIVLACPSSNFKNLIDCINGKIGNEWTALQSQGVSKINADETKMSSCISGSGCGVSVNYHNDWINLLDANMQNLARAIRKFWDDASRDVQKCILADIRNKFLSEVEKCTQQNNHPDFKLPSDLGPFPVAPASLYADRSRSAPLNRWLDDRINALIATKDCSSSQRHQIVSCLKVDSDRDLKQCIRTNICPACSSDFPGICTTFVNCIPIVLKEAGAKLTSLDQGSSADTISFLNNCGSGYSRVDAIKIWQEILKVAKQGLSDKFRLLLKDLVEAFFTAEGLCSDTCK